MKPGAIAAAAILFASGAAAASPPRLGASIRVSAGFGSLEEYTWAYPGADLVGTLRFGPRRRGFLDVQLGYSPLDNHTYLADGRMERLAVIGGTHILPGARLRLGAIFALEHIDFHADPDVLAEHPGVDILVGRGGLTPAAGLEAGLQLTGVTSVGVFTRVSLRRLELYDAGADVGRARLVLAGFFVESRLR